ncbi:RDD family protein [Sulfurovum sp. zt1-1]|uniref:RDD family protein n=1 Tax=Sulfurovum zhangzhouensis TaxID=3019067 RepID=A0ABT7R0I3_9BACT|nr:RDD family protein [Sulfurovum zhangzhouensis]MDM5272609.1 RDD family protein [Sulfurovum zhangzhouensis]
MSTKHKKRFRDIKQKKEHNGPLQADAKSSFSYPYASLGDKIKAFITDSFMLLMPIMYIVFYLVMGGREAFGEHKLIGWIYILVPFVVVQTLFLAKSAQTPGYRAYNLMLIDVSTGEKPSLFIILFRNLCAILSFFSIIGWVMMFFRKDRKTLHDLLSNTAVIHKP